MEFNAAKVKNEIVKWIADWFEVNGKGCNAIVGVSGGKDSSVVAALCVEALGRERVVGVLMPNGEQRDIDAARLLVDFLSIKSYTVNIKNAYESVIAELDKNGIERTNQAIFNLQPRLRMSFEYAVSQCLNGRVANTCNLSEDYVGYATKFGDGAGDFSPLSHLTVTEVKSIGRVMGLPCELVDKVPIDGLCGKSDEDNLGFTYAVLDRYIRTGECEDAQIKSKIDRMHRINRFKLEPMSAYELG